VALRLKAQGSMARRGRAESPCGRAAQGGEQNYAGKAVPRSPSLDSYSRPYVADHPEPR